jgi:hypothetical protein
MDLLSISEPVEFFLSWQAVNNNNENVINSFINVFITSYLVYDFVLIDD